MNAMNSQTKARGARVAVLVALFSFAATTAVVAQTPNGPTHPRVDDPERPKLNWKKHAADGRDLGEATDLNAADKKPERPATLPVSRPKPNKSPRADEKKLFRGSDAYSAELPAKLRDEVTYVHFSLEAMAKPDPAAGSILNIDGAFMGFRANRDDKTGRGTAELVTMDVDKDGNPAWQGTGIYFMLSPQRTMTIAPLLCAKIDPKAEIWTLYNRDVIVRENLPLLTTAPTATLTTWAGKGDDTAQLREFKISSGPPARRGEYVPTINGRVDLAKAHRDGHPLVGRDNERKRPTPFPNAKPDGK